MGLRLRLKLAGDVEDQRLLGHAPTVSTEFHSPPMQRYPSFRSATRRKLVPGQHGRPARLNAGIDLEDDDDDDFDSRLFANERSLKIRSNVL